MIYLGANSAREIELRLGPGAQALAGQLEGMTCQGTQVHQNARLWLQVWQDTFLVISREADHHSSPR